MTFSADDLWVSSNAVLSQTGKPKRINITPHKNITLQLVTELQPMQSTTDYTYDHLHFVIIHTIFSIKV